MKLLGKRRPVESGTRIIRSCCRWIVSGLARICSCRSWRKTSRRVKASRNRLCWRNTCKEMKSASRTRWRKDKRSTRTFQPFFHPFTNLIRNEDRSGEDWIRWTHNQEVIWIYRALKIVRIRWNKMIQMEIWLCSMTRVCRKWRDSLSRITRGSTPEIIRWLILSMHSTAFRSLILVPKGRLSRYIRRSLARIWESFTEIIILRATKVHSLGFKLTNSTNERCQVLLTYPTTNSIKFTKSNCAKSSPTTNTITLSAAKTNSWNNYKANSQTTCPTTWEQLRPTRMRR